MFDKNNILVTGGAGFIGSALCKIITKHTNSDLIILDKLTYASNLNSIKEIIEKKNVYFYNESMGNCDFVDQLLLKHEPKFIFNLAAETHVDNSILNPSAFIQTNILETHNLLKTILKYFINLPKKYSSNFRFLHISTDEVYGDIDKNLPGVDETSPYKPSSPYSASKAASDHLVKAYYRTYGLPGIISNCSNNYGPFQHFEKFIPVIIKKLINNEKVPVYGDGLQVREWIYVDDHCDALLKLIQMGKPGENYNIGSGIEITNLDLIKNILLCLKNNFSFKDLDMKHNIDFIKDRLGHDRRYAINCDKTKKLCNWKPLVDLQTGLQKTISSYI